MTWISPAHWLFRDRPEYFRAGDRRDKRTIGDHSRALARVRAELERGRPATYTQPQVGGGVLPPKDTTPAFRLPW